MSTSTVADRQRLVDVEERLAVICGELNAAHARMAEVIGEVIASELWHGEGLRSVEHWVAWKTGMSPARAAQMVTLAGRRADLPVVFDAFGEGELAVDQVVAIATRTPSWADVEVCQLARHATVTQLRKVVGRYPFDPPAEARPSPVSEPSPAPRPVEAVARCAFFVDDDARFRLRACGDQSGGAIIDAALSEARDRLFHDGQANVSWWDALVEVAQRSLDHVREPARRERFKTYLHIDVDHVERAAFTDGWALPDAIRRYLTCDGVIQPVWERDNTPFGVGRTTRVIPERTKRIVRRRDQGCRMPGCTARRWVDIHHVRHWEDLGPTETWNLVCLCAHHHRSHHQGRLGIVGANADDPNGLTFLNEHGVPIPGGPRPRPPTVPSPQPRGRYRHPTGERLDTWAIHFNRPRAA